MAPIQHFTSEVSCLDISSNVITPIEKTSFSTPVVVSDNSTHSSSNFSTSCDASDNTLNACRSSNSNVTLDTSSSNLLNNFKNINEEPHVVGCSTTSFLDNNYIASCNEKDINNNRPSSNEKESHCNSSLYNEKDITCEFVGELLPSTYYEESPSFLARLRNKRKRRRRLFCDTGANSPSSESNTDKNLLQNLNNCCTQSDIKSRNSNLTENNESCVLQSVRENSHVISSTSQPGSSSSNNESVSKHDSRVEKNEVIEIGVSKKEQSTHIVPMLPIRHRNRRFMNDPLFEDAHQRFEEAAKQVLNSYGDGAKHQDYFKGYRNLREANYEVKEAFSEYQSDGKYTVVLDARDFTKGSVTIKQVNEDELLVEGSTKKTPAGSPGTGTPFQRRFKLPIPVQSAKAFMSADGVLLITVAKTDENDLQFDPVKDDCISLSRRSSSLDDIPSGSSTHDETVTPEKIMATSDSGRKCEDTERSLDCSKSRTQLMVNPNTNEKEVKSDSSNGEEPHLYSRSTSDTSGCTILAAYPESIPSAASEDCDKHDSSFFATHHVKSQDECENARSFGDILPKRLQQKHEDNFTAMIIIAKHKFCYLLILWMTAIMIRSLSHVSAVI